MPSNKKGYDKQYRELHKDELNAKKRERYRLNRDAILQKQKDQRIKNPDRVKAYYKEYYYKNRDHILQYTREYHRTHKVERRIAQQKRAKKDHERILLQKQKANEILKKIGLK